MRQPRSPRSLVLGVATGLVAAGSAQLLWGVTWSFTATALLTVVAVAAGGIGWAWYLARGDHDDAAVPVVTSITMMATSVLVAHASSRVLHDALDGHAHVAAAAAGLGVLGQAFGWAVARGPAWMGNGRLRYGSVLAVIVSGVALTAGLLLMSLARDYYAGDGNYAVVAELRGMQSSDGRFAEERAIRASGFSLGRTCIHYRCLAHVQSGGRVRTLGPAFDQGDELRLLHNRPQGQLMLEAGGRPVAVAADKPSAWDWRAATIFDTGAWLASIPALTALAGFGLWTALVALALGARLAGRARALQRARAGTVRHGWLRFGDGEPPRRIATDEEGPVLLAGVAPAPGNYRGEGADAALDLIAGDCQDLVASLERRIRVLDAAALGLAACFSAPLGAAIAAWLLLL